MTTTTQLRTRRATSRRDDRGRSELPDTTFPRAEEIEAWPTSQVGESALVGPDLTLTITGLEADPELPANRAFRWATASGTSW